MKTKPVIPAGRLFIGTRQFPIINCHPIPELSEWEDSYFTFRFLTTTHTFLQEPVKLQELTVHGDFYIRWGWDSDPLKVIVPEDGEGPVEESPFETEFYQENPEIQAAMNQWEI